MLHRIVSLSTVAGCSGIACGSREAACVIYLHHPSSLLAAFVSRSHFIAFPSNSIVFYLLLLLRVRNLDTLAGQYTFIGNTEQVLVYTTLWEGQPIEPRLWCKEEEGLVYQGGTTSNVLLTSYSVDWLLSLHP